MGEPAVPMTRTRALRAWPIKGRGVRRVRIPRPGAATRLCLDPRLSRRSLHHCLEVEAIQPAASLLAAGLAGRRAGRAHHGAKGSKPLCGKVRPDRPTTRPVDHRLTLDPCGLAYSLLRPPASTPKVVAARGWTTGLSPQAIVTRTAETGPLDRLLRPRKGWLGMRRTAREKPQRKGRGPGSGRRPVPAGRSLERGLSVQEVQGDSPRPNKQREAAQISKKPLSPVWLNSLFIDLLIFLKIIYRSLVCNKLGFF